MRMEIEEVKPPYRLPTMDEIRAIPWNGLNVVSTFSGCGGSCLGFRLAGYRVIYASEFVPAARETYAANSSALLDPRDIREVDPEEILWWTGLKRGELDVFEGSPPCASFSMSGLRGREKKGETVTDESEMELGEWDSRDPTERFDKGVRKCSDVPQRTDDRFYEYVRLLDGLRPRVFVTENVPGLLAGDAQWYFSDIMKRLRLGGDYVVDARVLNAAQLGVPQHRRRVIFVGVRRDLGKLPAYPEPLPYSYSIRDALGDGRLAVNGNVGERVRRGTW